MATLVCLDIPWLYHGHTAPNVPQAALLEDVRRVGRYMVPWAWRPPHASSCRGIPCIRSGVQTTARVIIDVVSKASPIAGIWAYAEFGAVIGAFLPIMAVSSLRHRGDPTQRMPGQWMRR